MRDTESKLFKTTGGERAITIVQLPALRASATLLRLLEVLGPGLSTLAKVADPAGGEKMNLAALPEGVEKLFGRLNGQVFEELLIDMLNDATVTIEGERVPLDRTKVNTLFRGHVLELYKLFVFAVRVNFADFFDALGGLAGLAKKVMGAIKTPSASKVSSTSSGPANG